MQAIVQSIRLDVKDFTQLSPQVKFLLVFQLIILFILSILIGILFSPKFKTRVETQSGIPVVQEEMPGNKLTLQAETETMLVDSTQTVEVLYSGDPSSAVDAVISYIPSVFEVSDIVSGEAFDTVLKREINDDTIYFSGAQSPFMENPDEIDTTQYTVVQFTIKALRPTESASFTIDLDESVVAQSGRNILEDVQPLTIRVVSRPVETDEN